jgi:putative ABC transport system permease protein
MYSQILVLARRSDASGSRITYSVPMLNLPRDLRYATRSLLRTPGFAVVAILTLAAGIGATTAIYTVVKRVVLDPLAYPQADRLVRLKNQVPGVGPDEMWDMSAAQYFYLGKQQGLIEEIGAYNAGGVNLQTPQGPQRAQAAIVSASMMDLIGAKPALGRSISKADDRTGAAPVAVLSYGFWQRQFGADPGALGRTLELQGIPVQIVGVLKPGVELPQEAGAPRQDAVDMWVPLAAIDSRFDPNGPFHNNHTTPMVARLAPGVTPARAQEELDRLTRALPEVYPTVYSKRFFDQYGFRTVAYPLKEYVIGSLARSLWLLLGAVALVLLIACANVANLMLVRVEGRRRELAIRAALGAGKAAVARHLIAEVLIIGGVGGVLALLFSDWGIRGLGAIAPANFPRLQDVHLDASVWLFAFAVALIAAIVIALFPVLWARDVSPSAALADGGRGTTTGRDRQRVRSTLIVGQVALALILVIGAVLLTESFSRLRSVDPGIKPEGVVTVDLHLDGQRYQDTPAMWRVYDALLTRIRGIPGVTSAGMSGAVPLSGGYGCTVQGFEDVTVRQRIEDADLTTCAGEEPTTPGYFEAMGIPVIRGRTFTKADNDQPSTGAVIVSRAFAKRFWPGKDPIGQGVGPSGRSKPPFYRVVGVVGDVYNNSPDEEPAIAVYYPTVEIPKTSGWNPSDMTLVVRTTDKHPLALFPQVRAAIRQVDPSIPVSDPELMQERVDRSMSRVSFLMTLIAVSASMALLLAAVGLYGVISYVVARRTSEIGVRLALGARASQVNRLVLGGAFKLVILGLGVGGACALLLTQLMRSILYGVEPNDPVAYFLASAVLLGVAFLASYIPASRAARVDPIVALRSE